MYWTSKSVARSVRASFALAIAASSIVGVAWAVPITFSSAAATHDQLFQGTINPGAIDGNPATHGWGVFNGQFTNQSAVFTAAAPVNAAMLHIGLHQNLGTTGHNIEEFRLSVTSDPAPGFGSSWTQLSPTSFGTTSAQTDLRLSPAGANRLKQIGNSYLPNDTYSISAPAPFGNITGFRLELFNTGPNLNNTGNALGTGSVNGNLVLSEFTVDDAVAIPTVPYVRPANIALGKPVSVDFATWPGQPSTIITDGNFNNVVHPSGPGGNPNVPTPLGTFFEIDLDSTFILDSIRITGRADGCCPERLTRYRVQVLDAARDPVWTGDFRMDGSNPGVGGADTITAAMGSGVFAGQYIRIINNGGGNYSPQIAEVEAFGVPEPATCWLMGLGLAATAWTIRERRQRN